MKRKTTIKICGAIFLQLICYDITRATNNEIFPWDDFENKTTVTKGKKTQPQKVEVVYSDKEISAFNAKAEDFTANGFLQQAKQCEMTKDYLLEMCKIVAKNIGKGSADKKQELEMRELMAKIFFDDIDTLIRTTESSPDNIATTTQNYARQAVYKILPSNEQKSQDEEDKYEEDKYEIDKKIQLAKRIARTFVNDEEGIDFLEGLLKNALNDEARTRRFALWMLRYYHAENNATNFVKMVVNPNDKTDSLHPLERDVLGSISKAFFDHCCKHWTSEAPTSTDGHKIGSVVCVYKDAVVADEYAIAKAILEKTLNSELIVFSFNDNKVSGEKTFNVKAENVGLGATNGSKNSDKGDIFVNWDCFALDDKAPDIYKLDGKNGWSKCEGEQFLEYNKKGSFYTCFFQMNIKAGRIGGSETIGGSFYLRSYW